MTDLKNLVGLLKAAGEITRIRLLALLMGGELSVKDLTDILGQSQPRVSRHLKMLSDAGLLERNAEGAWAYYRLRENSEQVALVRRMISRIEKTDPQLLLDKCALEKVRAEHQKQADAYFAQVAQSWDELRNMHVPEAALEAAIVAAVGDGRIDHLLDLGTGTGRMLELLENKYAKGTGIDSSREMLVVARAKLAAAAISHAQVRLGDIINLDKYAAVSDLIVLHQVLHYFDDPGRILLEARQKLAGGGRMLVVDFLSHDFEVLRSEHAHRRLGLSQQQMEKWASRAGLEVVKSEEFRNQDSKQGLVVCLWVLAEYGGNKISGIELK
ncbi:Transcriptional regulator, ArsR family / Methyltransferase fusion [hydrothermal vent metagenome]|uniref:Transcriptional regulator, ArsR family / Methyltransferase fusion n=1 Tax=hydrothermal vent metagenome TaxID=652676 RepID=A0A3B0TRJ1_9ZZZZ